MYTLVFSPKAERDLDLWKRSGQKKSLEKLRVIFQQLEQHPFAGIGPPEPLRGNLSGKWSRTIDKKNRVIYSVEDMTVTVDVLSLMGHYNDK